MHTQILDSYHCCFFSDITGKTLTFSASGLFIQNRVNSRSGRDTRLLTDNIRLPINQFSRRYSNAHKTPTAKIKLLDILSASQLITSFDLS